LFLCYELHKTDYPAPCFNVYVAHLSEYSKSYSNDTESSCLTLLFLSFQSEDLEGWTFDSFFSFYYKLCGRQEVTRVFNRM